LYLLYSNGKNENYVYYIQTTRSYTYYIQTPGIYCLLYSNFEVKAYYIQTCMKFFKGYYIQTDLSLLFIIFKQFISVLLYSNIIWTKCSTDIIDGYYIQTLFINGIDAIIIFKLMKDKLLYSNVKGE